MNLIRPLLLIFLLATQVRETAFSQQELDSTHRYRVAVFTPLFLDSSFDASNEYSFGETFPKFLNSGLEFYEGIEMAVDSLQQSGINLDVFVFDSRSSGSRVNEVLQENKLDGMDLIIGHVNSSEARTLATVALKNQVPFININYPNDAGVTNNPFYVILNSTLPTHIKALYKHLQRNYSLSNIVYIKRKNSSDERLLQYFKETEKSTRGVPLKINYVTTENYLKPGELSKYLDSNLNNTIIGGSLDIKFGQNLLEVLTSEYASYPVDLFGMPTWENLQTTGLEMEKTNLYYGTPFYINDTTGTGLEVKEQFREKYYSRPSDMVYRGFETLFHFAKLLQAHGSNFASSIGETKFQVFTGFDIQPVLNPKTMTLDYFENQKIAFVKKSTGQGSE